MIAIIPARGGSKGVPGKNIKVLGGLPLIVYTINAALRAKNIDRVIVTTDDADIADVARKYGAEVPFIRPKHLAQDNSMALDAYLHAVDFLQEKDGVAITKFMVLLPTSPFRTSQHIDDAIQLFDTTQAETLISMSEVEIPPTWYYELDNNLRVTNAGFGTGNCVANRQESKSYYRPNGAIYILDYDMLKNERSYYCDNTVAYIMDYVSSVDIDTIDDFEYAEYLLRKKEEGKLEEYEN